MEEQLQSAVPENAPPPQPTPEQMAIRAHEMHQEQWDGVVDAERVRIARQRGLFTDPSVQPTVAELRAAVPLPGDTFKYIKLAKNRHGLPSWPKPKGRQNPRMTKGQMAVKSASLVIFRRLFSTHVTKIEAIAREKGIEFHGVPTEDLAPLGVRATKLGLQQVKAEHKYFRRRERNRKKLSRRINAGALPGNTNVLAYITN